MGRKERDKGKRGEREAADALRQLGIEAARGRQYKGTPDSPDVQLTGYPQFHVEVKRRNRWQIDRWIDQAEEECNGLKIPVILSKKDGGKWVASMTIDTFASLVKGAK